MLLSDLFSETYIALSSNKARSGLTALGIIIGIASVIAMVSIGQGTSGQIQSSIEGLGSNLLTISPGFSQQGKGYVSSGRGASQNLKNEDVEVLKAIEGVSYISPEVQKRYQIVATTGNNTNSTVIGVAPSYAMVRNVTVANGNFITDSQVSSLSKVVVLGPTVASDLFGEDNPIGQTIRINKINFKVVGVLQAKGGSGFSNPDDMAFVPLTTMQKILAGQEYLSSISISVASKDQMSQVKELALSTLAQKHNVDPTSPDFSILSQEDILGTLAQVTNTFTIFLASIAGISLLVGGIGIMNMMLTSVTERTREIGLRKAIGAKRNDISRQFLTEAIMLTFFGGVFGVIIGWLAAYLISSLANITTQVSWQSVALAFGISAGIGIVFGYYPAYRAAKLNPIEALRHE
ncbi:MAG: ABC transporter permease [Patescibacteria group bacterium]|nr:ABC transporter permease [Patescibacteria group bacterium]MDD4611233.1 ABC transporter permease [Patescibacteria group bacterium]